MNFFIRPTIHMNIQQQRHGKIGLATLGMIHVTLLKTTQYTLSLVLQPRWPAILDAVVCRHPILLYKILNIT